MQPSSLSPPAHNCWVGPSWSGGGWAGSMWQGAPSTYSQFLVWPIARLSSLVRQLLTCSCEEAGVSGGKGGNPPLHEIGGSGLRRRGGGQARNMWQVGSSPPSLVTAAASSCSTSLAFGCARNWGQRERAPCCMNPAQLPPRPDQRCGMGTSFPHPAMERQDAMHFLYPLCDSPGVALGWSSLGDKHRSRLASCPARDDWDARGM